MRLVFAVLVLAVARDADACSCVESGPPCQSFFQVQAVFTGTVKRVTPAERTSTGPDEVRVEFEDGTPAAGVTVLLGDPVRKWLDVAEPVDIDATGTFSFIVHEGLSYIVSAYYLPPNTRGVRPITTDAGPFVVTKEPALLELTVPTAP